MVTGWDCEDGVRVKEAEAGRSSEVGACLARRRSLYHEVTLTLHRSAILVRATPPYCA